MILQIIGYSMHKMTLEIIGYSMHKMTLQIIDYSIHRITVQIIDWLRNLTFNKDKNTSKYTNIVD